MDKIALKQLDTALKYLRLRDDKGHLQQGGAIEFRKFEEYLEGHGVEDVNLPTPIADHLQKDGLAQLYPHERRSAEPIKYIKATFEGIVFDGYEQKNINDFALIVENESRLKRMERNEERLADWTERLTYGSWFAGAGAVGLVLWEMRHFLSHFFCHLFYHP